MMLTEIDSAITRHPRGEAALRDFQTLSKPSRRTNPLSTTRPVGGPQPSSGPRPPARAACAPHPVSFFTSVRERRCPMPAFQVRTRRSAGEEYADLELRPLSARKTTHPPPTSSPLVRAFRAGLPMSRRFRRVLDRNRRPRDDEPRQHVH